MKVILSRKGMDSEYGRVASPILPDGTLLSLPIPDRKSKKKYEDIQYKGQNYRDIITQLHSDFDFESYPTCHLDPDIYEDIDYRPVDWVPAFGQWGVAATHLDKSCVDVGDIFLFYGMRESDIEVNKERIENSGLYHFNIKMKDIDSITLVNELPKFVLRTNGFDVGIIKKGFFKTEKGDVYKLSLRVNTKPYIKIYHSKNQILLLNYGDSIQTLQLFNNIKTHMK